MISKISISRLTNNYIKKTNTRNNIKINVKSIKNDSVVYPEYFELYVDTICKAKQNEMNILDSSYMYDGINSINNDFNMIEQCIQRMYVPPPEKQLKILESMKEIANNVNISSADGAVMKLLIREDDDTLNILLELIQQYYSTLDSIRIMIKHISLLSSFPS